MDEATLRALADRAEAVEKMVRLLLVEFAKDCRDLPPGLTAEVWYLAGRAKQLVADVRAASTPPSTPSSPTSGRC